MSDDFFLMRVEAIQLTETITLRKAGLVLLLFSKQQRKANSSSLDDYRMLLLKEAVKSSAGIARIARSGSLR